MKKAYFTFVLLILTQLSIGQSLSLLKKGVDIANTTITVTVGADSAELVIDDIEVLNTSASSKDIRVKRYEISYVPNTYNFICWGICESPFNHKGGKHPFYILKETVNITNSYLGFSGHYLPEGAIGSSEYRYVFFDINNPTDSTWFNVVFSNVLNSNNEIQANNSLKIYPNPVQDVVTFEFQNKEEINPALEIFNPIGQKITSLPCVRTANGIHTATWNLIDDTGNAVTDGIYICKYSLANQIIAKKIMVKR